MNRTTFKGGENGCSQVDVLRHLPKKQYYNFLLEIQNKYRVGSWMCKAAVTGEFQVGEKQVLHKNIEDRSI